MQRIHLVVPRGPAYAADTACEWYGDLGSGEIDYTRPLPPGRVRLWPVATSVGHLTGGHLSGRHLDAVDADGHLEDAHLLEKHLTPAGALVLVSPRYVFGRFQHALRMFDGAGNASPDATGIAAVTINSAPAAPGGLRRGTLDTQTGRLRFHLDGVRFAAVAGA